MEMQFSNTQVLLSRNLLTEFVFHAHVCTPKNRRLYAVPYTGICTLASFLVLLFKSVTRSDTNQILVTSKC